ncbi:MAG: HlyD family efflux transporter periplasmic adaptor subunit, partial [Myxococcota bacterium]
TLQGQLDVARAQLSAAKQAVAQATANGAQATAALEAVDQKLGDTKVFAAVGGRVLSRNREPGEVVSPGMSVLTVGDTDRPRLRVYVPLQIVQTLSVGDVVSVTIDARPDEPMAGTIEKVATEAEFTPRDILTPEERVKRVFAVDIALSPGPGVLPGIPAEADFE